MHLGDRFDSLSNNDHRVVVAGRRNFNLWEDNIPLLLHLLSLRVVHEKALIYIYSLIRESRSPRSNEDEENELGERRRGARRTSS